MVKCDRFLRPWSLIRRRNHEAEVCPGRSGCRHQKPPQRMSLKFLLQCWQRDRPQMRRGCCGSRTLPQKPEQGLRPNHPLVQPARVARFAERTIADGLSLLAPQLLESGISVEDSRLKSCAFAPPPPRLPVAAALTRH